MHSQSVEVENGKTALLIELVFYLFAYLFIWSPRRHRLAVDFIAFQLKRRIMEYSHVEFSQLTMRGDHTEANCVFREIH